MKKLRIEGTRFITEDGKQVILHGVNVLCRDARLGHFYPDLEQAFPFFQKSGFNLIRFGIFWNGAEPEPGKVDQEYLAKVKKIVQTAERYGIYVILDMHQDLFAQKYIDGAPDWACLDEGLPHPEYCQLWYQAYLESDAIIRAADNFWANKPAADGVGLLDHYENMWEVIAETFADCVNVIGYEPMNEPFMGSVARESFGLATMRMMEKNPNFNLADPEHVSPADTAEFLGIVAERFLEFDRTTLMEFYRRMARAIQKKSDKAIVTGGNIYCSTDLPTGIERLEGIDQIYAPHGYDSVVDSDRYESFSKENVERIYVHKREAQDRLGLPTIAAEWGAFPSRSFTNDLIAHMNGILEENLWGSAYCEYHPGMEQDANFTALCRAYPQEVAGQLLYYHYDNEKKEVTVSFDAVEEQETILFLPFEPKKHRCTQSCEMRVQQMGENRCRCFIKVYAEGKTELVLSAS